MLVRELIELVQLLNLLLAVVGFPSFRLWCYWIPTCPYCTIWLILIPFNCKTNQLLSVPISLWDWVFVPIFQLSTQYSFGPLLLYSSSIIIRVTPVKHKIHLRCPPIIWPMKLNSLYEPLRSFPTLTFSHGSWSSAISNDRITAAMCIGTLLCAQHRPVV